MTSHSDSGFTLMEMIVVIAIMGLILVLLANYGRPGSHFLEEKAAAQRIAQAMRTDRGRAIAQGHPVTLALPFVPAWLTVSVQAPPGGIVFAPDGSASGGSVLLQGDGRITSVTTDWLTGHVQIHAIDPHNTESSADAR